MKLIILLSAVTFSQVVQSIMALIAGIILMLITLLATRTRARWKQQDQVQAMQTIKIDAMAFAMGCDPADFKTIYEKKVIELMNENKFLNT